jgi:hypothetical protein
VEEISEVNVIEIKNGVQTNREFDKVKLKSVERNRKIQV